MSVDLPQPFGPRMQTCSPVAISRFTLRRAAWSPRITVTFFRSRSGGAKEFFHLVGRICIAGPILTERGVEPNVGTRGVVLELESVASVAKARLMRGDLRGSQSSRLLKTWVS